MARLVTDIGVEQRKHTTNAGKAVVYRQMAAAIATRDHATIAALPKYVPRGHPPEWYLERAEKAEQVSTAAGDMASLLVLLCSYVRTRGTLRCERRIPMDVPASPAEWPELQECLGAVRGRCRRPAGADTRERETPGLLTERPHQPGDPSADAVPGPSAQRVQACRTTRPGADEERQRQRVDKLRAAATVGDGVWVWEDRGLPPHGQAAVGVARQDAGTRGHVGHGPRDLCSPAPGPPAADAASEPSCGRPGAPPPSGPVVGDNRSVHRTRLTKILTT
jgi:hypothetical protein